MLSILRPVFSIIVEIPVEGNWPSGDDMQARNAVINELDEAHLGDFVGSGGGMGTMDFQYEVADSEKAKQQLASVMQKHLPGREYSVRARE